MRPDLSLVIPTFQEQERLPATLQELDRFSRESELEIQIVVSDDGSSDSTVAIAREWALRSYDKMTIEVAHIAHRGKGAAVREGMRHVRAPIVGCFDADLSPGTDAVSKLYDVISSGPDMVFASRGLPDSVIEVHPAWYRELAGRAFNLYVRRLAHIDFKDTQCGLKLWKAEVAREIFRHQRLDGFAFDAELVVLASRLGFEVEEVPVRWAHSQGSKVSLLRDAFRMSRDVVRIVRQLGSGNIHAPGIPHSSAMDVMNQSEDTHWWYQAKRRIVRESLLKFAGSGPCLDIGCGGGAMLLEAGESVPSFGIDLSNQALDHAHSRGLERLVKGEAGALPFRPGSFDSVLVLDVLEHHARPEQLLAEIREVLSPEGVLVVTVPAFQWMWSYADHVLGHYRRYNKGQLEAELEANGFDLHRVTYFHSWLLPAAWTFRKLRTLARSTKSADDFTVPGPLNWFLFQLTRVELRLMKLIDMPFGLSVLGIASPLPRAAELAAGDQELVAEGVPAA